MKNELDTKKLLRVFDKIRQHGDVKEGQYTLGGVKAYTDFDGYTVFIEDASVKLSFGFHNQYHYDYENTASKASFNKKLDAIDSMY